MTRKLKLYGWRLGKDKPENGRFVAVVYIRDGKVVVESDDAKLKQELHAAIAPGAYRRGFRCASSPHEPGTYQMATDPYFLEAVIEANGLWIAKTYHGWTIDEVMSKIIEEYG